MVDNVFETITFLLYIHTLIVREAYQLVETSNCYVSVGILNIRKNKAKMVTSSILHM